jgi:hypothetical protein
VSDPSGPEIAEAEPADAGEHIADGDRGPHEARDVLIEGEQIQDEVDQGGHERDRQAVVEHYRAPGLPRFVEPDAQASRHIEPRQRAGRREGAHKYDDQCLPAGDGEE